MRSALLVAIAAAGLALAPAASAAVTADQLRCEYRVDPLAVDTARPRLSWVVRGSPRERGLRQTAYRILVASDPARLRRGEGDLWDSGRVSSADTAQIAYAGAPPDTGRRCWWAVRLWDGAGEPGAWSPPATWSVGLLAPSDWKAKWIRCADPTAGADDPTYLPSPYLRAEFGLKRGVRRATLYATAAGLYEMWINGRRVGSDLFTPGWTEYAKRLYYQAYDVTRLLRPGAANAMGAILGDGWYGLHHGGRGRLGLRAQLRVEYSDGTEQEVATGPDWRATCAGPVRMSDIYNGESYDARREMAGWSEPGFDAGAWPPAAVGLSQVTVGRRDVTAIVRQAVRDGRLEITAGNELFGDPAYGVVKRLRVEYRAGGRQRERTAAEGERVTLEGRGLEIVRADYGPDPEAQSPIGAALEAHPGSPVRRTGEVRPVWVREPRPGVFVFSLGQNLSGWARLRVRGEAGQRVTLRFAEMLNPDGTIYTANLRRARCTDIYTLKGGGEETWEPRFTFHGFQYVEVTGYPGRPPASAITGVALNSDAPMTSGFECSNPLLNRLYSNIVWGQRSNYLEVPTDCPQRDERMGWSGDAQAFIGTAVYNMDVAAFFTSWMKTFNDSQDTQGGYPNVAPTHGGVSPAWGDAGIICPWTIHRIYGDTRMIAEHFDGMARWIDYLERRSSGLLRPAEGFGDWLNVGAEMPRDVIATAYFAHSADLLSRMATAIGRQEEARKYRDLFERIRAAFVAAYVGEDGRVKGDTQTTYLMALGFDLLPADRRPAAGRRLVELIAERDGHLSTGFLGVNLLLPVLTEIGRPDLAWRLLTTESYPSWLYSVTQGATTIWERWDGWTKERGFQTPTMNSFNHYAYGSCGEWMFRRAAGIDTDGDAFARIRVAPIPGGGLTWLRAHYDSPRGRIATEWRVAGGRLRLAVRVPPNTTATVLVPRRGPGTVTEGGRPAREARGVRLAREEEGVEVYAVGSGSYVFESPWSPEPGEAAEAAR